jgi:hypothetical protein
MVTKKVSLALFSKKAKPIAITFIKAFPVKQITLLQGDYCLAKIPGIAMLMIVFAKESCHVTPNRCPIPVL